MRLANVVVGLVEHRLSGSVTVGKGQAGISGSIEDENTTSKSSEAVTGSVSAGGNLNARAART